MGKLVIGIDTGGTFTDGFFTDGERIMQAKVDTTPHDLTVCFFDCLKEGAKALGFKDLWSLLKDILVFRFSSTTGTNILVQRVGSRPGIVVTKGYEDTLYSEGETQLPEFLITRPLVGGIDEQVGLTGELVRTPEDDDVLEALKGLLDLGARILVVSLHNSHINPQNEKAVKDIVAAHYPKHYLGSVLVIPASELCNHPDERGRTNLALLNGYIHPKVSGTLYRAEDQLRDSGYRKPLLITDSRGGCSRVAKTKAIDTVASSPALGYIGCSYWAKKYNIANAVTMDIGGTSFDIGLIVGGEVLYGRERQIFDIPVAIPMMEVHSIGLGGGSIAKVNLETKSIEVGPESAGAIPGPACYDLGGENPTVTDADVVLGIIDPGYFLGGRRKLNAEKARAAIDLVARPLGLSPEEVASKIADTIAELGATEIEKEIKRIGKSTSDFVLFAVGGAGPTHCCDIAEKLGISKIYTFPFASTFGAFGTSLVDVRHTYTHYERLPLAKKGKVVLDIESFNSVVREEQAKGLRDMIGEGFAKEQLTHRLKLEISEDGREPLLITSPKVLLDSIADGEGVLESYKREKERLGLQKKVGKEVMIEVFYVSCSCPVFKYEFPRYIPREPDPSGAFKTERPVIGKDWPAKTKVYNAELLKCGNIVPGPAILEAFGSTYVIPKGWRFRLDEFLNRVIEK
ncbi:MAG: hydantoinase/oxoprolinase family protein [Candidatus Hodarchaeota archaeon]